MNRLVKGICNIRPPILCYSIMWGIQALLNYVESCGQSDYLPLKLLTLKTVFLLAITWPSKSADLSQLYRCEENEVS